jgi:hypothetical protein
MVLNSFSVNESLQNFHHPNLLEGFLGNQLKSQVVQKIRVKWSKAHLFHPYSHHLNQGENLSG